MTGSAACVGPCNHRFRKAQEGFKELQAAYDRAVLARLENPLLPEPEKPDPPEITPRLGDPIWCAGCQSRIGMCLAELDVLAAERQAQSDGFRAQPDGQRVSGSRNPGTLSSAVEDVEELAGMLEEWEAAYRELMGWRSGARWGYLMRRVSQVVDWLRGHLSELLMAPFAEDFGNEVLKWHREFKAKTKTGTGRNSSQMPCSRCGEKSLEWEDGAEYVECTNKERCGRLMSRDEFEAELEPWQAHREALRKAGENLAVSR